MTKKPATPPGDLGQPPAKWNFFGPAPLLEGEDPAAYDDLLARVSGTVKPSDILEEIWVRDVVDLVWEALRLRRLKAKTSVPLAACQRSEQSLGEARSQGDQGGRRIACLGRSDHGCRHGADAGAQARCS